MNENFIGEIRMFAGMRVPQGWAFCDGRLLNIADYEVLYALIGTTYGGDGMQNFRLPDLRGRLPLHQGQGAGQAQRRMLGQMGGSETVTLTASHLPPHSHGWPATRERATPAYGAGGGLLGNTGGAPTYGLGGGASTAMQAQAVDGAGGSQPHENMAPYLCVNFIIALNGIFPSQS
ncbi:tail fiber protein [Massilia sp. MB5]|uniref:phage tail protein n=1 Tax=Massilia sp. MB5 TaxID=2919578 RepID=UPI001F0F9494|nr:tail fiber protein [Massilia sp. MB5]UMR31046.1 tail fiber protein [Massilia sp. MB5]